MRCPGCNKFVAYEEVDPEVDLSFDWSGDTPTIGGSVRIVNACEDCGEELKEATFDVDETVEIPTEHKKHNIEVDSVDPERTQRTTGKGRGTRMYYGAEMDIIVTCHTCLKKLAEVHWAADEQASAMDELV